MERLMNNCNSIINDYARIVIENNNLIRGNKLLIVVMILSWAYIWILTKKNKYKGVLIY